MTKRTPLKDRPFAKYTRGEEIFNMVTHIVGGGLAVAMMVLAIVFAAIHGKPGAVLSAIFYGISLVVMFTISGVYHGLHNNMGKKVMRIIDHCDIYFTIAGTYTPILIVALRPVHPVMAWVVFGVEWGFVALAATLNAIDLKKYQKFSFVCYLAMGWAIIMCLKETIEVMTFAGFLWIILGGVAFTIGALLYLVGKKKKYIHSIFHIFVIIGVVLQFFGILLYVL